EVPWGCGIRPERMRDSNKTSGWSGQTFCEKHRHLNNGQRDQDSELIDDYKDDDCNVFRSERYSNRLTSYGVTISMLNCGIVVNFHELYRSEGPIRALHHVFVTIDNWSPFAPLPAFLIYDNACGLWKTFDTRMKNRRITRTPTTDKLKSMQFVVDKFHITNQKRKMCETFTNPWKYLELQNINTQVCEQFNSKVKQYQNPVSSYSAPKSEIFYLLLSSHSSGSSHFSHSSRSSHASGSILSITEHLSRSDPVRNTYCVQKSQITTN
ncbi:unnamed protein product, partial [Didymodactylos carnosus]